MRKNEWIAQLCEFVKGDIEKGVNAATDEFVLALHNRLINEKDHEISEEEMQDLDKIFGTNNIEYSIALWSVLAGNLSDVKVHEKLFSVAFENRSVFPVETQFFLYLHIEDIAFLQSVLRNGIFICKRDQWLMEIVRIYRDRMKEYLTKIEMKERNKNLVFVVSDQILCRGHAPTEIAMEWCKVLHDMGKSVLLINTAETLTCIGAVPFWNRIGSYIEEYSELMEYEYEGIKIPFFQCPNIMPDVEILQMLLRTVRSQKPEFIVSIGDIIFSDLVDKIIPVYSLGLSADMPRRFTKYQSVYREQSLEEKEWMKWAGYSEQNLIRANFTFKIPLQEHSYTRKDLGIPEDMFCLTVVGNRLNSELKDDFLGCLQQIVSRKHCFVCFIGDFMYEETINRYPDLYESSMHIPYAKDLIAVMEICDLYVNPKRTGGGTSALFAMYQSKPVVTIAYGDVAFNAGIEFWVSDYEEMNEQIKRYIEDREFYVKMGRLAKEKAEMLTDGKRNILKQIYEIEQREKI